jgi:hypothetical protein
MALVHLIGEFFQYDSLFSGKAVIVKWGLLIITIAVPAFLFLIVKRRKKRNTSVLLCHNGPGNTIQKSSGNWEKGKKRIEKLLYEMTDRMHPDEYLISKSDLINNKKRRYYDIPVYGRTNQILRERNKTVNRKNESETPLDVRELKTVSTLAKQLQSRSHHSIRT